MFKFFLSAIITIGLVYSLNRSWNIGNGIPPLGKFLDPFHGFWQNAESKQAESGDLSLAGLQGEVSVVYDTLLIPHIFASNDDDLYRVMGYVTAQHRLWQMEFQTHAAAGRISEIVGERALDFDRLQRRYGMGWGAENSIRAHMNDPDIKRITEQYTDGVNAYISQLRYEDYPIEYKLLDYAPEPWVPLKMGLLLMNMSKTLNFSEDDLQMTNVLKLFGKEKLDLLFPDREKVGDPIVDNPGGWKFKPITLDTVPLALPEELITTQPQTPNVKGVGSNNWAVSGIKTANGSPILCNDPHLSLTFPSIWFAAHMNSPSVNVMGVTFTGAPVIILGFNDSIAWGATNAQRDLVDWYQIQFQDASKNTYLSDGEWKQTRKVVEEIKIKGAKPFYDTVIYTHQGPVVYDASFHGDSEKKHFAMRWIAHDESVTLKAFYELNRGKNYNDYMRALDHFAGPAQNFAFASVSGDIAIRIQGKYPVRRKNEGRFILDGTKTSTEWQAFIPNDQNVMIKNPARGFISSANQYPVDSTYPYYVHASSYEAYRNRAINNKLREMSEITPQDLMKLQGNNYNLQAAESLPLMLRQLDRASLTSEQEKLVTQLEQWDFNNEANSIAATYYEEWYNTLFGMIWDEMRDSKVSLSYPSTFVTIQMMNRDSANEFFDIKSTPEKEDLRMITRKAFSEAFAQVNKWKEENQKEPTWAEYKNTIVGHLLRIEPFSRHVKNGGHGHAINATKATHGPSWRLVASMEKTGVKAWGVYPGGQSGNPGSPFYDNLLPYWAEGKHYRLAFPHKISETEPFAYFTQRFIPQP